MIGFAIISPLAAHIVTQQQPSESIQFAVGLGLKWGQCLTWSFALNCLVNCIAQQDPLSISWRTLFTASLAAALAGPMNGVEQNPLGWLAAGVLLSGLLAWTGYISSWGKLMIPPAAGLLAAALQARR